MPQKKKVKLHHEAELPIIDVNMFKNGNATQRSVIVQQIMSACETYGFFYIQNHGIAIDQIEQAFAQSHLFFDRPLEFKNQYSIEKSDRFQGYEPQTITESKEAYVLGPERDTDDPLVQKGVKYHGANMWPDLEGWKSVMSDQMHEMLDLAKLLNRALALGLGVSEDYFDRLSTDPMCALRLLHYPAGQNRAGIEDHTDWGALSLLIQDDTPGLEILTKTEEWAVIPPVRDTIIVNIGEMVEIWTNGRFKATPHRVFNHSGRPRYSIAFFLDMDHDAILQPVDKVEQSKYRPIRVSDFIDQMHERDYGG